MLGLGKLCGNGSMIDYLLYFELVSVIIALVVFLRFMFLYLTNKQMFWLLFYVFISFYLLSADLMNSSVYFVCFLFSLFSLYFYHRVLISLVFLQVS